MPATGLPLTLRVGECFVDNFTGEKSLRRHVHSPTGTTMQTNRVTREQVLEASKGMLQKQFYVVFSTPTDGLGPVMQNLPIHLEHQCKIERDGILVAAGPHWSDDEQYWDGDGMFVIRATSIEHAKAIAAEDPMHQCGARRFSIRPWLVNEGRLNLKVDFSTGKVTVD